MVANVRRGFTLTEIMIVLAIFGIIVSVAAPTWFRQREISRAKSCQENLLKIYGAAEQYTFEFRLSLGTAITYPASLLTPNGAALGAGYLKFEPRCPAGGTYFMPLVGQTPTCSIGTNTDPFPPHALQGV